MEQQNKDSQWTLNPGRRGRVQRQQSIELAYPHDNENVVFSVREIAAQTGFHTTDEVMIATAASELVTNVLRYAGKGQLIISVVQENRSRIEHTGIELYVVDEGPGIIDISKALQENYSTVKNSLGMGLPSVKQIMDEFYIESIPKKGTRVLTYKWIDYERN